METLVKVMRDLHFSLFAGKTESDQMYSRPQDARSQSTVNMFFGEKLVTLV